SWVFLGRQKGFRASASRWIPENNMNKWSENQGRGGNSLRIVTFLIIIPPQNRREHGTGHAISERPGRNHVVRHARRERPDLTGRGVRGSRRGPGAEFILADPVPRHGRPRGAHGLLVHQQPGSLRPD